MEPPRASWSDWSTSKSMLCHSLDIWDPYPHLLGQPARRRPTRCNALTLPRAGSACDLANTLVDGLAKIRAGGEYDGASFFRPNSRMEQEIFEDIGASQHNGSQ